MGLMEYMGESPAGAPSIQKPVLKEVARTAAHTLTESETLVNTSNRGAVASVTITLPDAFSSLGKDFTFSKVAASDLVIAAAGTDRIYTGVLGGNLTNNTATELTSFLILQSVQTGASEAKWLIKTAFGTWTIN